MKTITRDNSDAYVYCGWYCLDSGNPGVYFGKQL
jgi:hypothetical protein